MIFKIFLKVLGYPDMVSRVPVISKTVSKRVKNDWRQVESSYKFKNSTFLEKEKKKESYQSKN